MLKILVALIALVALTACTTLPQPCRPAYTTFMDNDPYTAWGMMAQLEADRCLN